MQNNHQSFLASLFKSNENLKRKIFQSIKAKANTSRSLTEKFADWITSSFGTIFFLLLNIVLFIFWILINTNIIDFISVFDPFPFNLLTSIVSLEAIILSIFVLISQNRNTKIDDLREETHLQLDLISEREITKLMKMLLLLLEKNNIDVTNDAELNKMLKPINEEEIEKKLKKEIF